MMRLPWAFIGFGWAVAIALSTMTTKQHGFIDVLGGVVLAWGMFRWFLDVDKIGCSQGDVDRSYEFTNA